MAQLTTPRIRKAFEVVKIGFGMHPRQGLPVGGGSAAGVEFGEEPGHLHQVLHPALGLGVFRQASGGEGLHQPAHRHGKDVVAPCVPKAAFVPEKTCGHLVLPFILAGKVA